MEKDMVVSLEDTKMQYKKQILEGPLSILLALVEKEHFQAAKDILPMVRDSIESFEVTILIPKAESSTQVLAETVEALRTSIESLNNMLSKALEPAMNSSANTAPDSQAPIPVDNAAPSAS